MDSVCAQLLKKLDKVSFPHGAAVLVYLRYLAHVHQTNHWISSGDDFYGNHLLFERLYNDVAGEIDSVGERCVGLGDAKTVGPVLQARLVLQLIDEPSENLLKDSLDAEEVFLELLSDIAEDLKKEGTLTKGFDNLLADIADKHESHTYLLKQAL